MGYAEHRPETRSEPAADRRDSIAALRESAQRFILHADLLPPDDRTLLESVFLRGQSQAELARLMGCVPRTVHRRLQRLIARVQSPKFLFVGEHLARLSGPRRRVATACILHGLSLRAASRLLRMNIHVVRRHADALHAMFEAARRVSPVLAPSARPALAAKLD